MIWLRRCVCALWGGHHRLMAHKGAHMFMLCTDCGHETPGLTIDVRAS